MKILFGILLAGMLIVPSLGFTGDGIINDPAVTIEFAEDDSGFANGQMWSARSSKNDVEMIGCSYKAIELPDGGGGVFVYKWGFCQARDVNDVHVVCYSENPELLDAMQATTPFAWAQFSFTEHDPDPNFFGGARRCTQFGYSTQSFHLPEFTTKGNQVSDD